MARKQGSKTEEIRKLTKTGDYTYYVTIPTKAFINETSRPWRVVTAYFDRAMRGKL